MKKNILIAILFILSLTSCDSSSVTTKTVLESKLVEMTTSRNIKIFDGRTGDSFYITREDYIDRMVELVSQLRYETYSNEILGFGSSYNVMFEDENHNELSTISLGWPEDLVRINDTSYELNAEDKYLLHALVADMMYIMQFDANQLLSLENERIDLENEELSIDKENLLAEMKDYVSSNEYIEGYTAHKWSEIGGFYNYSSEGSPLIYPSGIAPHVNDDVKVWLKENPLVEVILRTNNNLYLVRIPVLENYVYVSENSLIEPVLRDRAVFEDVDMTINGCKIGDNIEKLKGTISGRTTFGVENGVIMVGFYDEDGESEYQDKGLAVMTAFNQIEGLRLLSKEFVLDDKFTIGDQAIKVLDYYDNKFGRDESYKNNGYTYTNERYLYIIDGYYLEFYFTNEAEEDSVIDYIEIRYKWWE